MKAEYCLSFPLVPKMKTAVHIIRTPECLKALKGVYDNLTKQK